MTLTDLIIPPQVKLAILAAAIIGAAGAGWWIRGTIADADIANINADIATQREQAVTSAREIERKQQEAANETLRKQNQALGTIATGLRRELARLQSRPSRPADSVPKAPGTTCQGATGAELSRDDAEFLVREASRADEIRAGLIGCYEVIDIIQKKY